jgi:polar amino acid transport system substrate-binding protein
MNLRTSLLLLVLTPAAAVFTGCATPGGGGVQPLRVGITPNYPPVIFAKGGQAAGVDAELAQALARELGRPLEFVQVSWDDQIPALLRGSTDLILSGMSVTPARKVRIAFSDPYMKTGQMALMRRDRRDKFQTPESILACDGTIGVIAGTTGDTFVTDRCKAARRIAVAQPADAPFHLKSRRMDLFIHDLPSVAWILSTEESELDALLKPLTTEDVACGLRPDDAALRDAVNAALAKIKADGTLDAIIRRWIPYYDRIVWP